MKTWVQTFSRKRFDYRKLHDASQFDIRDIAHHLSLINRYTGATVNPYSVAEHSLHVLHHVEHCMGDMGNGMGTLTARFALMHDASEAYLGDVNAPLKHLPEMLGYRQLEHDVEQAIEKRFALDTTPAIRQCVKQADLTLLVTEAELLLYGGQRDDWFEDEQWAVDRKVLPCENCRHLLPERAHFTPHFTPQGIAILFLGACTRLGIR